MPEKFSVKFSDRGSARQIIFPSVSICKIRGYDTLNAPKRSVKNSDRSFTSQTIHRIKRLTARRVLIDGCQQSVWSVLVCWYCTLTVRPAINGRSQIWSRLKPAGRFCRALQRPSALSLAIDRQETFVLEGRLTLAHRFNGGLFSPVPPGRRAFVWCVWW